MAERESRFMRIPANSLSSIPTKSGTILKGEHMSILKKVLARGINENRIDLNKLFNGKTDIIVAYSLDGLNESLNLLPTPEVGDYAILYNDKDDNSITGEPDGILIYRLSSAGEWQFVSTLSLIDMLTRIKNLEDADVIDVSEGYFDYLEKGGKEVATEEYVDEKDDDTLQEAKNYTYSKVEIDNKDGNTLQEAKDYTYSKTTIDEKDADTLQEAKDYADIKDAYKLDKIWDDLTNQTTSLLTDEFVLNRGNNVYKTTLATMLSNVAATEIFVVVQELPEIGQTNKIYLVVGQESEIQNIYDEFIWTDNDWEKIGTVGVDLSDYATLDYVEDNYGERSAFVQYQSNTGWAKIAQVRLPANNSQRESITFLVTAEDNTSTTAERYTGILELNTHENPSSSSLKWLVVSGFGLSNFNLRVNGNMLEVWVLPTVGTMSFAVLSETMSGEDVRFIELFDVDAPATRTGTSLGNSEKLTIMTNAEIKSAYEANSDTNVFTDLEKAKLESIEEGISVSIWRYE